ncbi:DUF2061 domain-containing protein [Natronobacterium lacisalsi]|uniref:DUF2061 domain-containing protein n=1 Tax=Natronobacterium lacisalsi TaxID=229731 RepID=UPI001F4C8CB9|nr:DUF2061 domain-containing protein [Halobiforma lacisalsi]
MLGRAVVTGNVDEAANIGPATDPTKTGTYYGYERVWNRITWGVSVRLRVRFRTRHELE